MGVRVAVDLVQVKLLAGRIRFTETGERILGWVA